MSCQHKRLHRHIVVATRHDSGGLIVDVICKDCDCEGSLVIAPEDVNWDEDEPATPLHGTEQKAGGTP